MPIPVSVHADTWSGPVWMKAHAGTASGRVHHARMTAAMDRLAQRIWGTEARSIRITPDTYEIVWVGLNPPTPDWIEQKYRCGSWHGHLDIDQP